MNHTDAGRHMNAREFWQQWVLEHYNKMGVSTRLEAVTMAIHHGVPLIDIT